MIFDVYVHTAHPEDGRKHRSRNNPEPRTVNFDKHTTVAGGFNLTPSQPPVWSITGRGREERITHLSMWTDGELASIVALDRAVRWGPSKRRVFRGKASGETLTICPVLHGRFDR